MLSNPPRRRQYAAASCFAQATAGEKLVVTVTFDFFIGFPTGALLQVGYTQDDTSQAYAN